MKKIISLILCMVIAFSFNSVAKAEDVFDNATSLDIGATHSEDVPNDSTSRLYYYYTFTTSANDSYYYIGYTNSGTRNDCISISFYDSNKKEIEHHSLVSDNEQGYFKYKLAPNSVYYLEVGTYRESFVLSIMEYIDDGSDSMSGAADIDINKVYDKGIQVYFDNDYYKFNTNESTDTYVMNLSTLNKVQISYFIYDEFGNEITSLEFDGSGSRNTALSLEEDSTYYVYVTTPHDEVCHYKFSILADNAINITKSSLSIKKGKSSTLKVTSEIDKDSVRKIQWTSSDKKVATVSSKGVVTGINKGTVIVTCKYTLMDGSTISDVCTVKIN